MTGHLQLFQWHWRNCPLPGVEGLLAEFDRKTLARPVYNLPRQLIVVFTVLCALCSTKLADIVTTCLIHDDDGQIIDTSYFVDSSSAQSCSYTFLNCGGIWLIPSPPLWKTGDDGICRPSAAGAIRSKGQMRASRSAEHESTHPSVAALTFIQYPHPQLINHYNPWHLLNVLRTLRACLVSDFRVFFLTPKVQELRRRRRPSIDHLISISAACIFQGPVI